MSFVVPSRYLGPPHSGNGGWVSGHIAVLVPTSSTEPLVRVRLSSPPPLDTEMSVSVDDGIVRVFHGEVLVGEGRPIADLPSHDVPSPISLEAAGRAEETFDHAGPHPFPTCYVCGPAREPGDGLRIFPGVVEGADNGLVASVWTPTDATVEDVWAALDCPGAWALGFGEDAIVLGEMSMELAAMPESGEEHIVLGWVRGTDGRKRYAGTALYAADGRLLAHADQTWIAIDPEHIRPVGFEDPDAAAQM
ncbi:hypothetical protein ACQP1U_15065 [Actinomycetota bacterium]